MPMFVPPESLRPDAFQEPEYVDVEPPVLPAAPRAPVFNQPQHGHDWTGDRPFQVRGLSVAVKVSWSGVDMR